MPLNNETLNRRLYKVLSKYNPKPLDSKGEVTPVEDDADVFKFVFSKDGVDYGDVFATIDDNHVLSLYYDDDVADSPSGKTAGLDYDDSWSGFLEFLKSWATQRNGLGWNPGNNKDHLVRDMARREHMKKKETMAEGYYPQGKSKVASYSDAVPNVKIILQHSRPIEEGEQRYRNIAKIFLENQEGERFLAPTTRPGIAKVYARHIAEGGKPHDDRWNHIGSLCEEYQKMAGFVRATRGHQFNESAQQLVESGINHYNSLRESLSKMTGHRGYNMYFESWTPPLMEDETDTTSINELFVQETLDPRIESVMPILSKLHKQVSEMSEVSALSEWADSLIEGDGGQEALNPIGIPEGEGQQLNVQQLATISDEALDNAYHYGRSTPGNTFGWQANLASAAYAKQAIDKGITDLGAISDAVHKGWWSVAQKFVDNPDQFDDTEKLRASGKFDNKMADRIAQMVPFNKLTKDQQDIDTVVARALLQAIKGQQDVAEGSPNDYFKRRKDEENRIAGTKAPAKRTPQQTDYAKRRAQEKKVDQGVAEGSEYKSRHAHKQEQDKAYDDYRTKHATSSMALMTRAEFAKDQRERAAKKKQGMAEGHDAPYWRVEQSEATGRYYVVTGYSDKSRKVWKNKLGAVDFNKKENAEAKANELNKGVVEGMEEDSYSNKFVQSQIDYYKKHLLSGNTGDQHRIRGSLMNYERIKNQRIKNNTWQEQGVAEGSSMNASQSLRDFATIARNRSSLTYYGLEEAGHADKVVNAIKACSVFYNYFKNNNDLISAKAIDNLRSDLIAFKNGDISTLSQLIKRGTLDKINLQEQGVAEGASSSLDPLVRKNMIRKLVSHHKWDASDLELLSDSELSEEFNKLSSGISESISDMASDELAAIIRLI